MVEVMYKNTKILIFLITIVLLSGCININVTPQNSGQSTPEATSNFFKTSKNIDTSKLDIAKIILNDTEIKDIIGPDWSKEETFYPRAPSDIQIKGLAFEKQNTYYKIPPKAGLVMSILPNTTFTTEFYNKLITEPLNGATINDYEIGESGKLIKINDSTGTSERTVIIFKINTIVVTTMTSVDQDTTIKLARKQEAKISRILEIIK